MATTIHTILNVLALENIANTSQSLSSVRLPSARAVTVPAIPRRALLLVVVVRINIHAQKDYRILNYSTSGRPQEA